MEIYSKALDLLLWRLGLLQWLEMLLVTQTYGSQCKSWRTGVMCSLWGTPVNVYMRQSFGLFGDYRSYIMATHTVKHKHNPVFGSQKHGSLFMMYIYIYTYSTVMQMLHTYSTIATFFSIQYVCTLLFLSLLNHFMYDKCAKLVFISLAICHYLLLSLLKVKALQWLVITQVRYPTLYNHNMKWNMT